VPLSGPLCEKCGHPYISQIAATVCPSCKSSNTHFNKHSAAFAYADTVRELVLNSKYHSQRQISQGLGELFAAALKAKNAKITGDFIVPIPLHPSKLRSRGFNQATILAKPISATFNIPIAEHLLKRIIKTVPQSSLDSVGREENLVGAFSCGDVANKHLILIDDIFTTGATMNTCAKLLLENSATMVDCYSLSIALKKD